MCEKQYLSHFLKDTELENNSLIISPTGSGKTHFIFNDLILRKKGKILYLCDNEALKTKTESEKRTHSNRKYIEGFDTYSVDVKCYKEFGQKVRFENSFIEKFDMIVCDEIHNLIDYQSFNDDADLSHAIKELFKQHDNTKIIYFTATPYYLKVLEEKHAKLKEILNIVDFSNSKEIQRYINRRETYINHISQIQFQLDEYKQSFEYASMKCLIFTREISVMQSLSEMCKNRGLKPICIWSKKNEANTMDDEQTKARDYLLKHGTLLDPYNVLIINRALETGINITDKKMNLAIINTTNLTQQIQVRGRIRHDIDLLVVRTNEQKLPSLKIELDDKYLNVELEKEELDKIIEELNIKYKSNQYVKITKFRELLENHKYKVRTKRRTVQQVKRTYYIITEKEILSN